MGFFSELFKKIVRGESNKGIASIRREQNQQVTGNNYNIDEESTMKMKQSAESSIRKEIVEIPKAVFDEPDTNQVLEMDVQKDDKTSFDEESEPVDSEQEKIPFFQRFHIDIETYGDLPITALSISQRLSNVLQSNGYQTIQAFLRLSEDDISVIKHSGRVTVNEAVRMAEALAKGEAGAFIENNKNADADQELRYCDRYGVNSEEYDHLSLDAVNMPNRLRSRLAVKGCETVGQFLRLTPKELREIPGAGKGTVQVAEQIAGEICEHTGVLKTAELGDTHNVDITDASEIRYCDRYGIDSEAYDHLSLEAINMPKRLYSRLTVRGCKTVGQFLRLTPKELQETPGAGKGTLQAAETVIGELSGLNKSDSSLSHRVEPLSLQALFDNIPEDRKSKHVAGYIQAFTSDEIVRDQLLSLCKNDQFSISEYGQVVLNGNLEKELFGLCYHFFSWLNYDLQDEIEQIGRQLLSNERTMSIITMRSNKKTLQDIGEKLNITRERVRQIERKANREFIRGINAHQIIKKIYAERNQDNVLTSAELSEYFNKMAPVFLYFLRGSESADYEYDEDMDVFIVEDRDMIDRVQEYIETLPETIKEKDYEKLVRIGIDDYGLNEEIIGTAIKERYHYTGSVYHRSRLTRSTIYELILREYYPEGLHIYDPQELRIFRQRVTEEYGDVKLPKEDRAIAAVIARVGILCGRGIYKPKQDTYISKDLEGRIQRYIEDSDLNIFLMNTLFAEFQDELEACGITNKYYLQGVLRTLFGDRYFFRRDYLAKDDTVTSLYNDIVQFIKASDYPVLKEEINRRYPGITEIVINIAVSDQEILNYFGQYLHASKLQVSSLEKEKVRSILETMTEKLGYVHGKDLYEELQVVASEFLSRNGIKFAYSLLSVLGYLFREDYEIERPYIARNGVSVDKPEEIISEFIRGSEVVDISEINSLAQEQHYTIYSILDFLNQYNDTHLLISKTQIASIEYVGLKKDTVALLNNLLLDEVMETRTIASLKGLTKLPKINVPWNEWLIYSIVNRDLNDFEVRMSAAHFRNSVAVIAPAGKMDLNSVEKIPTSDQGGKLIMADNLADIDDLIMDAIEDEIDL